MEGRIIEVLLYYMILGHTYSYTQAPRGKLGLKFIMKKVNNHMTFLKNIK